MYDSVPYGGNAQRSLFGLSRLVDIHPAYLLRFKIFERALFDYPKTETQLREILDKLYQHSKEAYGVGNRPAFNGLLEIMSAETTIVTVVNAVKAFADVTLNYPVIACVVNEHFCPFHCRGRIPHGAET